VDDSGSLREGAHAEVATNSTQNQGLRRVQALAMLRDLSAELTCRRVLARAVLGRNELQRQPSLDFRVTATASERSPKNGGRVEAP